MDLFGLSAGGSLAGADGPHGLVGEHDFAEVVGREVEQCVLDLSLHHLVLLAGLALLKHLADAENGEEAVGQSQVNLFFQDGVGLAVVGAALRVAKDDILRAGRLDHGCRHFAGVGAAGLVSAVLGCHLDVLAVDGLDHFGQVNEGRAKDDGALGRVLCQDVVDVLCQFNSFLQSLVHLPVSCYNFLSHFELTFVFFING